MALSSDGGKPPKAVPMGLVLACAVVAAIVGLPAIGLVLWLLFYGGP